MKKIFILLCGTVLAISCNEVAREGEKLTPDEQKEKIEETANMIMNECPASDFQEFSDFGVFLSQNYFNNSYYDYSAFENRYEELAELFYTEVSSGAVLTLVLSQCTGEFVFGPKRVTYMDSDKLSLKVTDEQGRQYLVVLQTSGEIQTIKNFDIEDLDITLKIPEKIGVVITRDNQLMASMEVTYNLRLSDNINPTSDMAEINETVTIKDYVINTSCKYDAKSHLANVDYNFTKGGKMIVSHSTGAEVVLSGNKLEDTDIVNINNYSVNIDIMGAIQVKGKATDYSKITSIYNSYDSQSPSSTRDAAEQLNKLISLKLYYDGTISEQAHIEFESRKYIYNNNYYYDPAPVIVFNDNSRYAIEEYFNEDTFKHLIRQAEAYAEMFVKLVDRFI